MFKLVFETPEYTANADASGALRLLEAIRLLNMKKRSNFIKHQLLSYMVIQILFLKMKTLHFLQGHHMQQQSYTHIG